MAWTSLSFAFGSILTSSKMTQLFDNFQALADGDSGAPDVSATTQITAQKGASLVLISSLTAASSTSLDFTAGISSTYESYLLVFKNIVPLTTATIIGVRLSKDAGATFISSGYVNSGGSSETSYIEVAPNGITNVGAGGGFSGQMLLTALSDSGIYKNSSHSGAYSTTTDFRYASGSGQLFGDTAAINAIRVLMSSGNIATGKVYLYGIRRT